MDVRAALLRAGGVARFHELREVLTRAEIAAAVEAGHLTRIGRGWYALTDASQHQQAAAALSGVVCGLSAAMFWGWKVKFPPDRPQVLVPRGRKIGIDRRAHVDLRWGDVTADDLRRGALSKVATALDCARSLPIDAAVAVVDSALRDGVSRSTMLLACERLPRTGRSRAIQVVDLADARAANPFESVLRATLLDVPDTDFVPQVWVDNIGRADLVDVRRRLVVEGDSFEFHSTRESLLRDMERYNAFQAAGYQVVRFGWEHAMFQPAYVREAVLGVLRAQGLSVQADRAASERDPRAR